MSEAVKLAPSPALETAVYSGIVGEECARSFLALCHAARGINIDEALTSPDTCPVPTDAGHQFAAASLLIRRANAENFANVVTFVERWLDISRDRGVRCRGDQAACAVGCRDCNLSRLCPTLGETFVPNGGLLLFLLISQRSKI